MRHQSNKNSGSVRVMRMWMKSLTSFDIDLVLRQTLRIEYCRRFKTRGPATSYNRQASSLARSPRNQRRSHQNYNTLLDDTITPPMINIHYHKFTYVSPSIPRNHPCDSSPSSGPSPTSANRGAGRLNHGAINTFPVYVW